VGSYRRGAATSGDIDVIITSPEGGVFKKIIDDLIGKGIIIQKYQVTVNSKQLQIPGASIEMRVPLVTTSLAAVQVWVWNHLTLEGTYDLTAVLDGKVHSETIKFQ
jgi:hypothetical protein